MPDHTDYLNDAETAAELSRQLAEARAEVERLREALKFYADTTNYIWTTGYCPVPGGEPVKMRNHCNAVGKDEGAIARAAIRSAEGER